MQIFCYWKKGTPEKYAILIGEREKQYQGYENTRNGKLNDSRKIFFSVLPIINWNHEFFHKLIKYYNIYWTKILEMIFPSSLWPISLKNDCF